MSLLILGMSKRLVVTGRERQHFWKGLAYLWLQKWMDLEMKETGGILEMHQPTFVSFSGAIVVLPSLQQQSVTSRLRIYAAARSYTRYVTVIRKRLQTASRFTCMWCTKGKAIKGDIAEEEILTLGHEGNENVSMLLLDTHISSYLEAVSWAHLILDTFCSPRPGALPSASLPATRSMLCALPVAEAENTPVLHRAGTPGCWMGALRGVKADHEKEGEALYEEAWQIKPSVLCLKVFSSNPVWSNSYYSKWIINYLT